MTNYHAAQSLNSSLFFFLDKQPAQLEPRLMELRFRRAHGNSHHPGDLFVFVAFNIVKHEYVPVAIREFGNGILKGDPIDDPHLVRIRGTLDRLLRHLTVVRNFFILNASPAEMHQHLINGQTVKPGGES